jgi:glycerophosphoryl diester phosphodiesterase
MELRRPLVVAHRGASGEAPENTLPAFELARAQQADAVEFDVRVTSDGHFVVIHDATVDRTTNGRGEVVALTLAEIRALDAGSWFDPAFAGTRVPTLAEVLGWAAGVIDLCVEVKTPFPEPVLADLLQAVAGYPRQRLLFASFDWQLVRRLKLLAPWAQVGLIWGRRPPADPFEFARRLGGANLHPNVALVDPSFVEKAHRLGLRVFVWTVDGPDLAIALGKMGVDGIVTDYPAKIRSALLTLSPPESD